MTIKGHIQDGQIVLDEPANVLDGTPVTISFVDARPDATEETKSLWDGLLKLAGTVEGLPPDFALNHDHYIHGTPKRHPE